MKMKRWVTAKPNLETVRSLARSCGFTPLAAAALCARGIDTPEAARAFLETDPAKLHAKTAIEKFLKDFISSFPTQAEYKTEIKDRCLYVYINGKEIGNLIGYRGEALYALENILKAIANKKSENKVVLRLDIENYKQKRVKTLEDLANKKAKIVEKTGKLITLEPMQAYERKVIHTVLQNNPNVETRSIGQEPKRRIVISKK